MKATLQLLVAALLLAPLTGLYAADTAPTKPNVIFILAGDIGYRARDGHETQLDQQPRNQRTHQDT